MDNNNTNIQHDIPFKESFKTGLFSNCLICLMHCFKSNINNKTSNLESTPTEEATKSGSLLLLEKNRLLFKIGDQRCDRKCYPVK